MKAGNSGDEREDDAREEAKRPPRDTSFTDRPLRDSSYTDRPPRDTSYTDRLPHDTSYTDRPPRDTSYTDRPPRDTSYTDPRDQPHDHRSHFSNEPSNAPPATDVPSSKEGLLKDLIAATGMFGLFKMLGENQAAQGPVPQQSVQVTPSQSLAPPNYLAGNVSMGPKMSEGNVGLGSVDETRAPPSLLAPSPIPSPFAKPTSGKPSDFQPVPSPGAPFSTYVLNNLSQFYNIFQGLIKIPKNATNTVYVEGIPSDASEREVARKSLESTFSR